MPKPASEVMRADEGDDYTYYHNREESDAERIERGMAMLDKELGREWPILVDLSDFSIDDGARCVIGWVFNPTRGLAEDLDETGYAIGIAKLFSLNSYVEEWVHEYDFNEAHGFDGGTSGDLWKEAIAKRQEEFGGSAKCKQLREQFYKDEGVDHLLPKDPVAF